MKKLVLFFAMICGVTFFTAAQTIPKIKKTQVKQTARIAQGVGNGEITRFEAKQLRRQQRHIQKEKCLAKADGVVTRKEKAHIRHDLNLESKQ
jgi:hypothetical protein